MRELKFRAWDGKIMHYDALKATRMPEQTINDLTLPAYWAPQFDQVSMQELMQYTGLKDKNGVEIYEGDIVNSVMSGDFDIGVKNGVVTWDTYEGQWHVYKKGLSAYDLYEYSVEVISNIYESPELLEANNEDK